MTTTVAVLGGGIGGLSAAHELAERGFDVDVYEKRSIYGGKARSVPVPGTAREGTEPLPGEHGFRFFPAFYRHLFDTMERIPDGDDSCVYDNLEPASQWMIARRGESEVTVPLELPEAIEQWDELLSIAIGDELGVSAAEKACFVDKVLRFLTTCEERRRAELDDRSWWEFVEAEDKSEAYRQHFGVGLTSSLVAMQPEVSSTRTIGRIYVQLLLGMAMPWLDVDRLLDGPTNDVWIDPWVEYLESLGVTFHTGTTVERIAVAGGRVDGVEVAVEDVASEVDVDTGAGSDADTDAAGSPTNADAAASVAEADADGATAATAAASDAAAGVAPPDATTGTVAAGSTATTSTVTADHYVCALPVEVVSELLTDELATAAPSLADVDELDTAWMNGIQFYFDEPVSITDGHVLYQGSPWSLTSICQHDFWEDVSLSEYGSGDVEGILSICISDWTTPGEAVEKPARECTPAEIKREVWAQLTARLNDGEEDVLDEDALVTWFLDPSIEFPAPNETTNAEPLLINTVGSLQHRPEADTAVQNLFLAADYVRTNVDLATMEAANEAARRAVNGILEAVESDCDRCSIWPLEEPAVFEPLKQYDRLRFEMGLPHHDA